MEKKKKNQNNNINTINNFVTFKQKYFYVLDVHHQRTNVFVTFISKL